MTEPNGHDPAAAQPPRTAAERLSTKVELWEVADKLAQLTRTEILVYLIIRCRARDGHGRAFPSLTTIAREAQCARRHVSDAINKLVALGLIAKEQRRSMTGDFNSTEYTLVDPQRDEGGSDAQVTRWGRTGHQVVTSHGTKLLKRKKITEKEPPTSVGDAREGEGFSNDGIDEKQGVLLLPINGGGDRMAPLKRFNPSDATVEWAAERYGINARDPDLLGEFIDYHLEHNKLPADIEAAYRRWIRRQPRFDDRDAKRSRGGRQHGTPEVNAAFDDALSQMRAHGARQ